MGVPGSGRRAAPAKLRLLNGSAPGRDSGGRPVELPPPFDDEAPEAPAYLSEYGARVWEISIPQLVRLKLTKREDFAALASYCEAVEQFRVTTLDLQERGYIHETVKPGVRFIARTDPDWSQNDAYLMHDRDDRGGGALGYFVPSPMIERRANPSAALRNAAMSQIKALGSMFGFSPSALNGLTGLDKIQGGARGGNGGDEGNPFEHLG